MRITNLFKRHKHDWELYEMRIVHYPDYEPHKIGIAFKCKICGKIKKKIMNPDLFIRECGFRKYYKVMMGEYEKE